MPGSVGNTGLAGNHAVKCCQVVLSDFEVIRLKIRLNFVAARSGTEAFSLENAVGSRPHPYQKLWMLLWCTHSYQGRTFNPLISFPQNIDLVDNFCVIIYHVATPATFVFDVVSHTHYINVVVSRIFSVSINGCYTVYSEFPL